MCRYLKGAYLRYLVSYRGDGCPTRNGTGDKMRAFWTGVSWCMVLAGGDAVASVGVSGDVVAIG